MTRDQRSRLNPRVLMAIGLAMSIATTAAIAVHLAGAPEPPGAIQAQVSAKPSDASTGTAQGDPGSRIDHSVVRQLEPELPTETTGMSIGAYGA